MKSCFEHWPEIATRLRASESIFLALDYDGVLSPIAAQPGLAILSSGNRQLLEQLIQLPRFTVAIISGRSLADVKSRVGISNVIYAGNHGVEIDLPGSMAAHTGTGEYRLKLSRVREELTRQFSRFNGVLLEDKGYGVGLHYRELDLAQLDVFHATFADWSKQLPDGLQIVHAKKMVEVRPGTAWNKGNAVQHIWQTMCPGALPICLGDDLTDEDGFLALKGVGINIFVGEERQSHAEYILHSTDEVTMFLRRLLEERAARRP